MDNSMDNLYPNCPTIQRTVKLGELTKAALLLKLHEQNIQLNELGKELFDDNRFMIANQPYTLQTVELRVRYLGFKDGATLPQLFQKAEELRLHLCPLEVGPLLRLLEKNQTEGAINRPLTQNKAPYGSITIASPFDPTDHSIPKGFYLRKIEDVLWLRGYTCDDLHVFSPDDTFIFCLD